MSRKNDLLAEMDRIINGPPKPRTETNILNDLRRVENSLSPENLHCDGEISHSAARQKAMRLNAEKRRLINELGRTPTDQEIWSPLFGLNG